MSISTIILAFVLFNIIAATAIYTKVLYSGYKMNHAKIKAVILAVAALIVGILLPEEFRQSNLVLITYTLVFLAFHVFTKVPSVH